MRQFFRALTFFRADLHGVLLALGLILLAAGAGLVKPWPLAVLVDSILGEKPLPSWLAALDGTPRHSFLVLLLIGSIPVAHFLQAALAAASQYAAIDIGLRGLRRVRQELYATLLRLSPRFFHQRQTGDVIYRATWDTSAFQTLFQQGVINLAVATLSMGLMFAVMFRLNPRLALVSFLTVPLVVVSINLFGRRMRERGAKAQAADGQIASLVQQTLAALPLIRISGRESDENAKFAGHAATAHRSRLSQHGWELVYGAGVSVAFGLGLAGTLWVGIGEVTNSRLTVGQLLIFLAYLGQWYEPLNQLSHVGSTVSTARAGVQRVFELLDAAEETRDVPGARPVGRAGTSPTQPASASAPHLISGALTFKGVTFGYQPDRPVLREVNLAIAAGERVALVGSSGAGKSTLLQLIARFHDPNSGAVLVDGVDLRQLKLADWRAQIAVVFQEPILLAATVAENIAYGKPTATRQEIEAAAATVNAHEFILRLPQGYDTPVGEGAARLSAGEKQRLHLARAFLKDAPILLLDEPTSALDADNETTVLAGLDILMRGRTTLFVTHRLGTVQGLDRVLVLKDGQVSPLANAKVIDVTSASQLR